MPNWQDVLEQSLPNLRRFMFCLTGSRLAADEVLTEFLPGLLGETCPNDAGFASLVMYRSLQRYLQDCEIVAAPSPDVEDGASAVHANLLELPLHERMAVVLTQTMQFTESDAAVILECDEGQVGDRARVGLRTIRRAKALRALIIEDDTLVANELAAILRDIGFTVSGTAVNRAQALSLAQRFRPDLILADLRLRNDEDGSAVVREIRQDLTAKVVYVTGFPQAAPRWFDPNAGPIVTKPFRPRSVIQGVQEAFAG